MGECFQWRAHGQCSKGDPRSFSHDTQASGNSGAGQRREGRSSSPAPKSKAKQTDGEKGDKAESFYVNLDCWDRNTPSNSPRAPGAKSKFGTERSHREELFKSVNYHERSPCAPKFEERALEETLQQERCARRVPWRTWRKMSTSSNIRVKLRFGASMHMLSKKDLSSDELDTV